MKPQQIDFSDFAKLDIRVGEVVKACEVEASEKLLKLTVDFGLEIGQKTIFAGIKKWYTATSVQGRKFIFIVNLAPKRFTINTVEYESQGMLLALGANEAVLYNFDKDLPNGTIIR